MQKHPSLSHYTPAAAQDVWGKEQRGQDCQQIRLLTWGDRRGGCAEGGRGSRRQWVTWRLQRDHSLQASRTDRRETGRGQRKLMEFFPSVQSLLSNNKVAAAFNLLPAFLHDAYSFGVCFNDTRLLSTAKWARCTGPSAGPPNPARANLMLPLKFFLFQSQHLLLKTASTWKEQNNIIIYSLSCKLWGIQIICIVSKL